MKDFINKHNNHKRETKIGTIKTIKNLTSNLSLNSSIYTTNSANLEESVISNNKFYNFNDVWEHKDELVAQKFEINARCFFKKHENFTEKAIDVNSCFVIESMYPRIVVSFIRYYDESKLDAYRMTFRLRNFRTNKFLTLKKFDFKNSSEYGELSNNLRIIGHENLYKFTLTDGEINTKDIESTISTADFQNSLFGFVPALKVNSNHPRPLRNEFLRLYNVATKCFLKVLFVGKTIQASTSLFNSVVALIPFEDEESVFKVMPVSVQQLWDFRFLNSISFLLKAIISNITENRRKEKLKYSK